MPRLVGRTNGTRRSPPQKEPSSGLSIHRSRTPQWRPSTSRAPFEPLLAQVVEVSLASVRMHGSSVVSVLLSGREVRLLFHAGGGERLHIAYIQSRARTSGESDFSVQVSVSGARPAGAMSVLSRMLTSGHDWPGANERSVRRRQQWSTLLHEVHRRMVTPLQQGVQHLVAQQSPVVAQERAHGDAIASRRPSAHHPSAQVFRHHA